MRKPRLTGDEWRAIKRVLTAPRRGRPIEPDRNAMTLLLRAYAGGKSYWQLVGVDRAEALRLYARRERLERAGLWRPVLAAAEPAVARWRSRDDDADQSDTARLARIFGW